MIKHDNLMVMNTTMLSMAQWLRMMIIDIELPIDWNGDELIDCALCCLA